MTSDGQTAGQTARRIIRENIPVDLAETQRVSDLLAREQDAESLHAEFLHHAARHAVIQANFGEAELHLEQAISIYDTLQDTENLLQCQLTLCRCMIFRNQATRARHLAKQVDEAAQAAGLPVVAARAQVELGNASWRAGHALEALEILTKAESFFADAGLDYDRGWTALGKSTALILLGRGDESVEACECALAASRKHNDSELERRSLNNLGGLAFHRRDWQMARHYLMQCMALEDEEHKSALYMNVSYNLGLVSIREGELEDARKALLKAVQAAQRNGDRELESACFLHLGIAALLSSDIDSANNYMSLALRHAHGDSFLTIDQVNLLGALIHLVSGRHETAQSLWVRQMERRNDPNYDMLEHTQHVLKCLLNGQIIATSELSPMVTETAESFLVELEAILNQ
jgi:tetratricopeptide (TPR) repeat protein